VKGVIVVAHEVFVKLISSCLISSEYLQKTTYVNHVRPQICVQTSI